MNSIPSFRSRGRATTNWSLWHSCPGQRAFSLVEVVVALAICIFTIVPLFSLSAVALRSATTSIDTTRRSEIVQQVASQLAQTNYAGITNATFSGTYYYFNADGIQTNSLSAFYQVQAKLPTSGVTISTGATSGSVGLFSNVCLVQLVTTIPVRGLAAVTNNITVVNQGY